MADETTTARVRETVADRQWIDQAGSSVDDPAEATGCRYIDLPTKKAFVYQTGLAAGNHATMLAIFGALTKIGNIRSTLSGPTAKNPDPDPIAGVEDWFQELIDNGNWAADRVGGGIRFNSEILARAIAHVKGEHGEDAHLPYKDKIDSKLKVKDPGDKQGKREILYATFAYRNTQVKNKYHELLPADTAAPSAGDL